MFAVEYVLDILAMYRFRPTLTVRRPGFNDSSERHLSCCPCFRTYLALWPTPLGWCVREGTVWDLILPAPLTPPLVLRLG